MSNRTAILACTAVSMTCLFMLFMYSPSRNDLARQINIPLLQTVNVTTLISATEEGTIHACVSGFSTFRLQRIDRTQMEKVRVNIHTYLTPESRVLEVGGYTGVDAAKLIAKYNPYYLGMEPIPRYYTHLENKYKNNPKFKVLKYGLGKEDKTLFVNVDTDATSLFRKEKKASASTTKEKAHIREVTKVFEELEVKKKPIDLITINCEGCEYELLDLLISTGVVKYLKNIQFQFHLDLAGISNQERRYCQIMTLLARTHKPLFQYTFTWQCWTLL